MNGSSAFEGGAPVLEVAPLTEPVRPAEKDIYQKMWDLPQYRVVAPGEEVAHIFRDVARPKPGAKILDLGCGTGRGSLWLALFAGLDVTMVDFTDNCLDEEIRPMLETQAQSLRFVQADLTKSIPVTAQYGYCTDVMEHIPPADVERVLDNILHSCQHVFFQIATEPDICGELIGHDLHLTVQPYAWWLSKFNERDCVIHWSQEHPGHCMFYATAWTSGDKVVEVGVLNITEEQVKANVKANIAGDWMQVQPHETNDVQVMIVGGGPSLAGQLDEIKRLRAEGVKLVTLNGAYNWALDNGLTPSAEIIVDARPCNAEFTRRVVDDCKYLISSQCDPSVLEGLPKDRTLLWHTTTDMITDILNERYEIWWGIPGGSTVLLRAIPLLRMLGFKSFYLFGCDSCVAEDGSHHVYDQAWNNGEMTLPVSVGDRIFQCTTWHTAQAQEFMDIIKVFGDEIELEVKGGGLLAYILEHAADLATQQEFFK